MLNPIEYINNKLETNKLKFSTFEDFTGGMISSKFSSFANSHNTFVGGYILRNKASKISIGVDAKNIDNYGENSSEVSNECTLKTNHNFKTDVCIGFCATSEYGFLTVIILDKYYSYKIKSNEIKKETLIIDYTAMVISKVYELLKKM
jgi:hypothetical protein